jgi:hypothetical protein
MSLWNKFSVGYNMEKARRKSQRDQNDQTAKIHINIVDDNKEVIGENIVEPLLDFGYSLDQVMTAFKIYKYRTVDEAIYILMRDPETSKYNHRFIKQDIVKGDYEQVVTTSNKCKICGGNAADHADYSSELNTRPDFKLNVESDKNIKETTSNNEHTEISGIVEKKMLPTEHNQKRLFQAREIDIPQETLDLFEDPEVCLICFAEKVSGNNKAQFACGHKFCKACVINHLNTNINNGRVYEYININRYY